MKINQKEINIKSLIKDFSIETTPNVYAQYGQFTEFLSEKNDVYVTYLPDEKSKNVIETSKKINEEGLTAILICQQELLKMILNSKNILVLYQK